MKRGRPASQEEFRREILEILHNYQYPATISTVKGLLDARRLHPCGWHTVRKYLQELTAERLVHRDALPTIKGRRPLVVYIGQTDQGNREQDLLRTFSTD